MGARRTRPNDDADASGDTQALLKLLLLQMLKGGQAGGASVRQQVYAAVLAELQRQQAAGGGRAALRNPGWRLPTGHPKLARLDGAERPTGDAAFL